jgi:hypothetical protein
VQDVERRARHGSGSVLVRDVVEKNVMLRKGQALYGAAAR